MSEKKIDSNKQEVCQFCNNCRDLGVELRETNNDEREYNTELSESKCSTWLQKCNLNTSDTISEVNSETSEDISSTSSVTTEDAENYVYNSDIVCENTVAADGEPMEVFQPTSNTYKNIKISKCKNIRMGNVTKIYGPVHITQKLTNVNQESVTNQIFLNGIAETTTSNRLNIVNRRSWLAQPPIEQVQHLSFPPKLVIISHTATEHGFTQAENVFLVRTIQTFHIESKKWNDIAYNFLIGCDGIVYEGRGWGIVGAHTLGYNVKSIGISFIGCYMKTIPTQAALDQAKALIQHGVEIGAIDKNYIIVGHCQCCPTESPGRRLFEEIQTWEHWSNVVL